MSFDPAFRPGEQVLRTANSKNYNTQGLKPKALRPQVSTSRNSYPVPAAAPGEATFAAPVSSLNAVTSGRLRASCVHEPTVDMLRPNGTPLAANVAHTLVAIHADACGGAVDEVELETIKKEIAKLFVRLP